MPRLSSVPVSAADATAGNFAQNAVLPHPDILLPTPPTADALLPAAPLKMHHVLIVEDDPDVSALIERLLRREGYTCTQAVTAQEGQVAAQMLDPGVILLDLSLPDSHQDLDLLRWFKRDEPRHRVIIMTAHDNLDLVVGATQAGAFDFITKGPDLSERVRVTVRNAFAAIQQEEHVNQLSTSLVRRDRFSALISHSSVMEPVRAAIDRLSHSRVNVLVMGQSGTGKEVVARTIHDSGLRAQGPFVAINCAGIPDTLLESELFGYERGAFTGAQNRKIGKFELASGGTLFLDEIGEMSLPLQAKLLRVLQDGRFERLGGNTLVQTDTRILAATNRDLLAMVRQGLFREDLFYRLAVFTLVLPQLSERKGDIPPLVHHFVQHAGREERKKLSGVTPEVMRLFESHPWPGNVRQLQNVIARSALQCDTDVIALRDLPTDFVQDLLVSPSHGLQAPVSLHLAGRNQTRNQGGETTHDPVLPHLHVRMPHLEPGGLRGTSHPVAPHLAPAHHGTAQEGSALLHANAFSSPSPLHLTPRSEAISRFRDPSPAVRLDAALDMAFPTADILPTVEELEAAGIRLAMRRLDNNVQLTARRLHISRATLYRRLDLADRDDKPEFAETEALLEGVLDQPPRGRRLRGV